MDQGLLTVWDGVSGEPRFSVPLTGRRLSALAYTPDGRRLLLGSWDHSLLLVDAATGREVLTLRGHTDAVTGVAFGGGRIASAGRDRTVKVWDARPVGTNDDTLLPAPR
jgi:WD40 repeat protein